MSSRISLRRAASVADYRQLARQAALTLLAKPSAFQLTIH